LDFNEDDSWYSADCTSTDLWDLLEEAANELDDNGEIFCAIVPESACSEAKGYGWPGGLDWIGGASQRVAYWRATKKSEIGNYIEAHEVGHALNLDDNGGSIKIVGVDLRNPDKPELRLPSTEQMMKKHSDLRWINPGEYLWVHYRDFWMIFDKCIELELNCSISVFYVGI